MKVRMIKPVYDTVAKIHYVSQRQYGLSKVANDGQPNMPIGSIAEMEKSRAKVIVENGYGEYVDPITKVKRPRAKTNLKKVK